MTAAEARALTEKAKDATHGVIAEVVADVHRRIAAAAQDGHNAIDIDGSLKRVQYHLRAVIKDALKQEGYKVESHSDQRDGDWTTVSW
jgi:hypothetical protein